MAAKKRVKLEKVTLAYVTTKDKSEALAIGKVLVEKRLAACVNIIPSMVSSYRWEGKVERAKESILLVKSVKSKKGAIIKEVKKLHSYRVPCILFFNSEGGNPDYIKWLIQGCL